MNRVQRIRKNKSESSREEPIDSGVEIEWRCIVKTLVTRVQSISPATSLLHALEAPSDVVQVQFESGDYLELYVGTDQGKIFLEVLDDTRRHLLPIYVEADDSGRISSLRLPKVCTVSALHKSDDGDVEIDLEISHAKHVLRKEHPGFSELLALLERSHQNQTLIAVTESEDGVIDVRETENPDQPASRNLEALASAECDNVSLDQAKRLFKICTDQSCSPLSLPPTCIPFLYPADGCWGRAHEMCRLLLVAGTRACKIWIYGNLSVKTRNDPNCVVRWGWHVAPVLDVSGKRHVLDPSMFAEPVAQATWVAAQNAPAATTAFTDSSIFYRSVTGATETDPTFGKTAQVLATYRGELKLRTARLGPPPFAHCSG